MYVKVFVAILAFCCAISLQAEVKIHPVFSDGMVLQRNVTGAVFGFASDGEKVEVSIAGQTVTTTAVQGKWKVQLRPLKAGGPHTLKVNKRIFKNVMIGDVWICGGQSNMEWSLTKTSRQPQTKKIISSIAKYKNVRILHIPNTVATTPSDTIPVTSFDKKTKKWITAGDVGYKTMSGVGFTFGALLNKQYDIPIGLIDANKGGSPIEAWMSKEAMEKSGRVLGRTWYNAMLASLHDFPIKGAIWYQGESNARTVASSALYAKQFKTMIEDWRQKWQVGEFPFLFVMLAGWEKKESVKVTWPVLRESQASVLKLANTGCASAVDLGSRGGIHPSRKYEVAERLFISARKIAYGEKIVHSGPTYKSVDFSNSKAILTFTDVGSGLDASSVELDSKTTTEKGKLVGFTIAGADGVFVDAQAEISGNSVIVSSPQVKSPKSVRYAWTGFPVANLYNKEGLPALPFRTDHLEIKEPTSK